MVGDDHAESGTDGEYKQLSDPEIKAVIGILGIVVGGFLGHWLALGRENRGRRAAFVGELSGLKALIARTEDADFPERFANLCVAVEKECGRVRVSIGCRKRRRLDAIRLDLSGKNMADLQDFDNSKREFPRVMTYQAGRAIVGDSLAKLIEVVE